MCHEYMVPLVQVSGSPRAWETFRTRPGPLWRYVNVTINPYTDVKLWNVVAEQIMVVQFVIHHAEYIHDDGLIKLTDGMSIAGAIRDSVYNIRDFP